MWLSMAENSGSNPTLDKLVEPADHHHEKAWWQSKKFIAFLLCELGFFLLMGAMLYLQEMDKLGENIAFMVLAVTAGFGMVGYCLGQSYIDRYIRVAAIMVGKPMGVEENPKKNPEPDEEKDGPTD